MIQFNARDIDPANLFNSGSGVLSYIQIIDLAFDLIQKYNLNNIFKESPNRLNKQHKILLQSIRSHIYSFDGNIDPVNFTRFILKSINKLGYFPEVLILNGDLRKVLVSNQEHFTPEFLGFIMDFYGIMSALTPKQYECVMDKYIKHRDNLKIADALRGFIMAYKTMQDDIDDIDEFIPVPKQLINSIIEMPGFNQFTQ